MSENPALERDTADGLRIVGISLDCADPGALATFYLELLGGELLWRHDRSAAVRVGPFVLIPQFVDGYRPPSWPGTSVVHLDLSAGTDGDRHYARAITLGAKTAEPQPDERWRVLLDPAGHPFCITPFSPDTVVART